ncbi:DUF4105 domain-containing protein [Flavobacterium sp. F-380]|uniref:DUF4105 domain-containing protein n=1 Tax=Flavobacterium kayseriense TaxID=2764714 RepID=A0ABR7J798_9FLAO|nr:DUF4105 domain-containing protein [Flavobacterium kayseriense]MBC5841410.1 DUF4105 domain-containing protein [Flavobacterium kayseriense]MBC5847938.1 DUF4105 domain-containing protein [Flavobacterium kayseriense]
MTSIIFKITKTVFSILLFLFTSLSFSQTRLLSQNSRVSVITCGTGNESYSLFGHTAIRISDPENSIDAVFNYGAFDFNTPNFVAKFAKGDLEYFAVAHSYTDFINEYTYEKRSVYEQELLISTDKKQQLFDNLSISLASGDSHYTYKFIDKNCTSMVVDIINKTLGSTVITKKADTDITYRSILYPYFDNHFYEKLGTSIIFGTKVDRLGTNIFLPFELLKSLKTTQFQNKPLAQQQETLLEFKEIAAVSWWNNAYTYIIVLVLIAVVNKKSLNQFYFITMGILGLFFIFMGFYSDHLELEYNYNILLFNPGLLLLSVFYVRDNSRWIYKTALFNILCLLVYCLLLINKAHFLIVLPLIITSAFLLTRLALKNKKRIPIIL